MIAGLTREGWSPSVVNLAWAIFDLLHRKARKTMKGEERPGTVSNLNMGFLLRDSFEKLGVRITQARARQ